MLLTDIIKKELEAAYHIHFDVTGINAVGSEDIKITLSESYNSFFYVSVCIKDDTRLVVECEPEKYGASFVYEISQAEQDKKKIFTEYWSSIEKTGKFTVKLNEIPIEKNQFIDEIHEWRKINVRYTKAPFYDPDEENRAEKISQVVVVICGMMLSLLEYEIDGYQEGKEEGSVILRQSKKYERNPINRELCIMEKGYQCSVCGFNFEENYGEIGKNFIHVHHSIPVAMMGENHIVNPSKELFPVCPNCHAMLHRKNPPYSIDELKDILEKEGK